MGSFYERGKLLGAHKGKIKILSTEDALVRRKSGNGRTRIHTGIWTPEYHTALLPTSG